MFCDYASLNILHNLHISVLDFQVLGNRFLGVCLQVFLGKDV